MQKGNAFSQIVLPGVLGAMLIAMQVGLRALPNIEAVTISIIVCAYLFSPKTVIIATLVFCTGEWLIYGFGYWVVAYYIYWPMLASVSILLKIIPKTLARSIVAVIIAFFCTLLFGVITSAVDAFFLRGFSSAFFKYFKIVYVRGVYFYAIHIVSNTLISALVFTPLSLTLKSIFKKYMAGL